MLHCVYCNSTLKAKVTIPRIPYVSYQFIFVYVLKLDC